ncbi:MAG TPA: matrixin family metalloprotease [Gemmatimonadales bacterium]|nr:matrixin family metalloprotease [Gemmatimonadales bacterium]
MELLEKANESLRARGLNIRAEKIEYYTIGRGRPADRLHTSDGQWVPNDFNRLADGTNITYIIASNRGATASGLTAQQTTDAIQRSFATWAADKALGNVELVRRAFPNSDVSIFDELVDDAIGVSLFDDFGPADGDPFAADIVNVGFLPWLFFEIVGGPGGGDGILAFSVSFIFVDENGAPTDLNGDNRVDIALNEVYYNDAWGNPAVENTSDNPWNIGQALPAIDVETVALHENGHSLQLGHFGSPPPKAVMNPFYGGVLTTPLPLDRAGLQSLWSSWPNR